MKVKGKKYTFLVREAKLPDGRTTRVEMIEHPGAALIIPFITSRKIIMLRQYRAVLGSYLYELPAGTLEKGEKPLSCAQRELAEETGYGAKKLTRLGKIIPVPGYSDEVIHIFKAEGLTRQDAVKDVDEIIQTFLMSRQEVLNQFRKGKVVDGKTICALAFCRWL